MATVWAHRVGAWSKSPASGWSHTIAMRGLTDLVTSLSNAKLNRRITHLAIVAHGDAPGTVVPVAGTDEAQTRRSRHRSRSRRRSRVTSAITSTARDHVHGARPRAVARLPCCHDFATHRGTAECRALQQSSRAGYCCSLSDRSDISDSQ